MVVRFVDIDYALAAGLLYALAVVVEGRALDEYAVLFGVFYYLIPNRFLFSSRPFLVISKLFRG